MHLLLLSLGDGALGRFVADCIPRPAAHVRIGIVAGAGRELLADRGLQTVDRFSFADVDAVYIGGGNTFEILHQLRQSGTDRALAEHVRAGLPYIGLSAGSVIAGPDVAPAGLLDDPSSAPDLVDTTGLGLIDRVIVPHAGGILPAYPRSVIDQTLQTFGADFDLLPLDDDQAVLVDGAAQRVISSV